MGGGRSQSGASERFMPHVESARCRVDAVAALPSSLIFRFAHPRRNVAAAMEDAPDIHVISAFHIEHELRVILQRPMAQAREIELIRTAR